MAVPKALAVVAISCAVSQLTGCSVLSSGVESVHGMPKSEIQLVIEKYEAGEALPERTDIGELYAYRSLTKARYVPTLPGSRISGAIAVEAFTQGQGLDKFAGVPYLLVCPFAFVVDVVLYPIDLAKSMNVPETDVQSALCDLQKARANGYTVEELVVEGFGPSVPYLDRKKVLQTSCEQ